MAAKEQVGVRLTPEQLKDIEDTKPKIERAKVEIAALKKMGMDTRSLEDKLQWSEDTGKLLLDVFGPE